MRSWFWMRNVRHNCSKIFGVTISSTLWWTSTISLLESLTLNLSYLMDQIILSGSYLFAQPSSLRSPSSICLSLSWAIHSTEFLKSKSNLLWKRRSQFLPIMWSWYRERPKKMAIWRDSSLPLRQRPLVRMNRVAGLAQSLNWRIRSLLQLIKLKNLCRNVCQRSHWKLLESRLDSVHLMTRSMICMETNSDWATGCYRLTRKWAAWPKGSQPCSKLKPASDVWWREVVVTPTRPKTRITLSS